MNDWQNKYAGTQKVNPDQYLDIAIKSIISLPNELMAKEANFDVKKFLLMKTMLTEQLENIGIGLNLIESNKQEYELESINDNQKELRENIINYFKKEYENIGIGAVSKADATMRFIIEGPYSTGIKLRTEELYKQVKDGTVDKEVADAQVANLKLQLILKASKNKKVKALEIDV